MFGEKVKYFNLNPAGNMPTNTKVFIHKLGGSIGRKRW